MPELPEVETIKLGLEKRIVGLTLKNIQVFYPKGIQFKPVQVVGKKVLKVWRKAKMLGVDLSGDLTLLFHLKMTGQLILSQKEERIIGGHPTPDMKGQMPNKSTVAIFEFDPSRLPADETSGSKLYFNDQRRFGWVKLFNTPEVEADNYKKLGDLGPEPLEPGFSWQLLKEKLSKYKNKPIKVAIMDQSAVSGVGNIYASESLFLGKVDPRRKVSSLSDEEFKKIHQGIVNSLKTGIKHGGSTRAHFVNVDGEKGYFLDYANVYGKEGYPCKGCSGKVQKIALGGRGTYFCPSCQK